MSLVEDFVLDLQYFLCKNRSEKSTVIRIHSKKLDTLGEVSFPLNIKNWCRLIADKNARGTIFECKGEKDELGNHFDRLKEASKDWVIQLDKFVIVEDNLHLFVNKSPSLFQNVIHEILGDNKYGHSETLCREISIKLPPISEAEDDWNTDLTNLRLILLKKISLNVIKCVTSNEIVGTTEIMLTSKSLSDSSMPKMTTIFCGPVLDEKSQKTTDFACVLYAKRSGDMRLMAQHKYGLRFETKAAWKTYFEALGKAAVTFEMLSSKPQKAIKISLHDLHIASKGASFVFYNCARLNVLLERFEKMVEAETYPRLPELNAIDFSLLNEPEEWELFYVYILQYPILVKRCVKDIENGDLNVHNLVTFLTNLSTLFSKYYRRVKILTSAVKFLNTTLYARIYLLKSIQYVFHHALSLMDIEPIKEM